MIGLGRSGFKAGRRALSSAAAQASATATSQPPPKSTVEVSSAPSHRKPFVKFANNVPPTPVEQIRLQKKYQEGLESNKFETLHDAVEYIEWRGTVFPQTISKIISLLEKSSDLATLSDRQLAVILSVFGATCDTLSRQIRAQHLQKVEAILKEKGVVLGLSARNQLIEAKIDNRSQLDAVEELQAFEESGIELDGKSYALLCEIYAKQSNTKAITDIIAHMKSVGIPLTEDHVAQLVYSVARGGNYSHVGRVVDTFATSMNVVRLRCAAARAIAEREKNESGRGGYEVTEMLRAVPTTAKMHSFDNNIYVVNVLMDLVENGQLDAFSLLSSYLIVSESGSTLGDNKLNLPLVARAKSLLSEGNIEEAIVLYSCVHPNYSNDFFLQNLQRTLEESVKQVTPDSLQSYLKTVTLAENKGLLQSANEFLLTSCSRNTLPAFLTIFEHVQNSGDARTILGHNPGLKKPIARQLAHLLVKKTSPTKQMELLSKIAIVLFAPSAVEGGADPWRAYEIVYKIANKDIKLVLPALDQMPSTVWHEKREFATGIVHQLLYSDSSDHLATEKLQILLESNKIGQLNSVRLHKWLTKYLLADSTSTKRLKIVAKILALDFRPPEAGPAKLRFGGRNLVRFFSNEAISAKHTAQLVQLLEDEGRVSLSTEELVDAQKVLSGAPEKLELLRKLKKSVTWQRWRSSDVEQLLKELQSFSEDVNPAVKLTLRRVIVEKTLREHGDDLDFLVQILEKASEWRKEEVDEENLLRKQLIDKIGVLEYMTLSKALSANDMVLADRIWQLRSPRKLKADVLLSYASRLFIQGNLERADEVCALLRQSSQTIRPQTLEKMGRRLKGVDVEKMSELAEYLGKTFNLRSKDMRRVVLQAKTDLLTRLIKANDLAGALRIAVEETSASGRAFGQVPLMIAAIKCNDRQTLESVHTMVRSAHDTEMANINLAYALIHADHTKRARDLVERQNLNVGDSVLQYFTTIASTEDNPRLLKDLFIVFNGRASTLELNKLLELATKKMWINNDLESLDELSREIETTSFPLTNNVRTFFDNIKSKHFAAENADFD
ncbi:unnamed protein product [Caenorhabditis sp. 36 PRJEB53466]|nr:unnamed protein product [Caenorhabditis sp. 36 PRJEB53466]